MKPFCTSPLWDWNYTWHSEYPRLTPCFETTVVAYTPLTILVAFGLFPWPVGLRTKPCIYSKPLPGTALSLSRYVASLLLTFTFAFSLTYKLVVGAPSGSSVAADLVFTITFGVALKVQENDRKNGIRSSMLLFFFWLVTVVCKLPECFRHLWDVFKSHSDMPDSSKLELAVWAIAYPIILLQLLLSCVADGRQDKKRPYLTPGPLSSLFFWWMTSFIVKRSRHRINLEDIYAIPPYLMARQKHTEWSPVWNQELNSAGYMPEDGLCAVSRRPPSMLRSLCKAYWKPVVIACILAMIRAMVKTLPVLLLHYLVDYMAENDPLWRGVLFALGIASGNFGTRLLTVHTDRAFALVGLNVKSVIIAAIYRKTLRLSSLAQRKHTIGDLINLVSVDADRIFRLSTFLGYGAGGLMIIMITFVLLWQYLGVGCLAGVTVMLAIMPLASLTVGFGNKYQSGQMKLKDRRLSTVAEMLNCVKVLKLFAWEELFMDKCTSLRLEEMSLLNTYSYLVAVSLLIMAGSSCLVAFVSFVTYVLISPNHVLDPATVFVCLALINQMQFSLFLIPNFISNAVRAKVSMRRIQQFLLSSEVNDCSVGRRPDEGDAVSVRNATVSWMKDGAPTLRNLNMIIKSGQLVAVIGPVGSGKSSLLSALLGDLRVCSGSVNCVESVAYVPQCPWIQNKSVRENVLFSSTYNAELYEMVIKACCLEKDLEIFPGGDLTEIGEKGTNLSGGQKQRVSLARAAYQRKELYLLDDPLSAVDAHVGASLFKDLIGPRGMLKDTTRLLITHNLSVLSEVDYIVVMQEGLIVESGTFNDLKQQGSVLSGLLKDFFRTVRKLSESEDTTKNSRGELEPERELLKTTLVEKETLEEGSISLRVYVTYLRHAGPLLALSTLIYGVYRGLGAFTGIWLGAWSKDSLLPGGAPDLSLRGYRVVVYLLLCIFQAVSNFFAVVILWKVTLSASTTLHQLMLRSVMRAPLSFYDATPPGSILNRFGRDVEELDIHLPMRIHFTVDLLMFFASTVVLICINLPVYIMIVIPLVLCLLVLRQIYVVSYCQVKRLETATRAPVNNHLSETLTGLSSVRGYGVQRMFLRDYEEKTDNMQNCTLNLLNFEFWMRVGIGMISELLLLPMLLLLVTNRDKIDPATAGLLVSYMLCTLAPLDTLVLSSAELDGSLVSAERLDEYIRLTPEPPWTSKVCPDPRWPVFGAVSFKSYSTRYREGLDLVLKDIDLDMSPGEKIGIVGRTGAGKSTITLSLFRIVEAAAGRILVDGVDIAVLGLHDLRSRITIIPQDPVLFHGTIRFNLDPSGQHDAGELWSALDRSHVGDFFRKDGGLDFQIAEGGLNLSVGQRQLVCLARAVLRNSKILVLDEATASVDMRTDLLVQQTLREAMKGCTVLTIAHRLHSVLSSDRVVVMDQGRVVEIGTPANLLADETSSFHAMARNAGALTSRVKF